MITIPQHGENRVVFDMRHFKLDIEKFFVVEEWEIQVEWCLGENAQRIEQLSNNPMRIKDSEFWSLYAGIHQTIDGSFAGFAKAMECCRLEAVDSSFWNVTGSIEFEKHMQTTYGLYRQLSTP